MAVCTAIRCRCGIVAYLNHQTEKTRREIIKILIDGLRRLEYRGYDSAGGRPPLRPLSPTHGRTGD